MRNIYNGHQHKHSLQIHVPEAFKFKEFSTFIPEDESMGATHDGS